MKDLIEKALKNLDEMKIASTKTIKTLKIIRTAIVKGDYSKLNTFIDNIDLQNSMQSLNLGELYEEIKKSYNNYLGKLRLDFDKEFKDACNNLNLRNLTGNSMDQFRFKGIIQVKINFSKNITEIKTFARQRTIKSLDANRVAKELNSEVKRLFERHFDPRSFLEILFDAYKKIISENSRNVLLKDVHRIVWVGKQNKGFFEKSDPGKMVQYPLDEFSVDLSNLLRLKASKLDSGYSYQISLGSGGINIYGEDGSFNSYKFLEFIKGGNNG